MKAVRLFLAVAVFVTAAFSSTYACGDKKCSAEEKAKCEKEGKACCATKSKSKSCSTDKKKASAKEQKVAPKAEAIPANK